MKKIVICALLLSFITLASCVDSDSLQNMINSDKNSDIYDITMKRDILSLMMAYPEYVVDVKKENKKVYIIMKSGKKILYDDKMNKSYEGKMNNPDIQDMLEQIYPIGNITTMMDINYDPGRVRIYPLLKEIYGGYKESIEKNLVIVRIGNKNYSFNKSNDAANSLKIVMKELNSAMSRNKNMYSYVFPCSGTYNYRVISGTGRLSPHSFGIAIDLKRDNRDYWKWSSRKDGQIRIDSYPRELVKIFERNGFIWGGKWGHFDILHFEYRPEFLVKGRYFSKSPDVNKEWYDKAPLKDIKTKSYIDLIDKALS